MVGLSSETSFSGTLASNLSLLSDEVVAYDPRAVSFGTTAYLSDKEANDFPGNG